MTHAKMEKHEAPPPRRVLGRTGIELSVVGFGGIIVMNEDPGHAREVVAEAVARGVNYFDVAPTYGDAEVKLGPALEPHRNGVFLACKTELRDAAGARAALEESLRRMRTDHFDLYQLHAITDPQKDVEAVFAPGGAMETLVRAREQGLVRHLGFSAHSPAAALRAMELFDFDTILYPVNMTCNHHSAFDAAPLEMARRKGMGILALKAMARGPWESGCAMVPRDEFPKCWYEPFTSRDEIVAGLRFTLAQPGVTAALPPGEESLWRVALELLPEALETTATANEAELAARLEPIFR